MDQPSPAAGDSTVLTFLSFANAPGYDRLHTAASEQDWDGVEAVLRELSPERCTLGDLASDPG